MAPGVILWVCWALLFRSGIVSTNEGSYRLSHPSRNLHDDDDGGTTLSFDEGTKKDEDMSNPNSITYASYNMPTLKEPLAVVPTGERPLKMQSSIHLEKMINAGSRNWEPNYFNPITFPLTGGNQVADQTQSKVQFVLPQSNPNAIANVKPVPQRQSETSSVVQVPNPPSSWSVVSSSLQSKLPVHYGSDDMSPVHYQNPDEGSSQSRQASDNSQSLLFEGASNYNTASGQMQPKPTFFHSQLSPPGLNTRREDLLRLGETSHTINLKPTQSPSWSVVSPSLQSKQPETSSDKMVPPVKYLKVTSSKGKFGSSPPFASNYNSGSSLLVSQTQSKPVNSESNQNNDYASRELVPPSQLGTSYAIQKTRPSHISMIPPRYQSKMPVTPGGDKAVLPVPYQKPSSSQSGIGSSNYSTDTGSNLLVGFTQQKQSTVLAQSSPQDTVASHGSSYPNLSGTGSGSQMTDSKQGYTSTSWPMASPSGQLEKPLIFKSNPAGTLSNNQRLYTGQSTGESSTPLLEGTVDHNTDSVSKSTVDPKISFKHSSKFVSPSFDQSPKKHYEPNLFSQSPPVETSNSDVRLPVSVGAENPVSPVDYQKSPYDSNPGGVGLVKNPNLSAGHSFYNSRNRGTLSGLAPKPMPVKLPQKPASLETVRWDSHGNDFRGSSNENLRLQKKPPMKFTSDIPESQSYGQPSTAFASPMWETLLQSPETQVNKDWMFQTSGVLDNWNLEFPKVSYQPQNSLAKIQKAVAYQPASSKVPVKKRIIHSRNGYKRQRLALSKAAYNPKYYLPLAQDAMANPFKRLSQEDPLTSI